MKNIVLRCFWYCPFFFVLCLSAVKAQTAAVPDNLFKFSPAKSAVNVNPDTHLEITFNSVPAVGSSGKIRVFNAVNGRLVDSLDMSVPAGPTQPTPSPNSVYTPKPYEYVAGHFTNANTKPGTPSGGALPTQDNYQLTIIGGFTDGFHFYPVIVHGNTATIYLHNNLLEYGKSYYVEIDPGVITLKDNSFNGIKGKNKWSFKTKKNPPAANSSKLIVSVDGTGDFNTVQGAMDFIPDYGKKNITVFIKNGLYEEIVYFRNKSNVTIIGEDRDKVIVQYKNSEVFNPHPLNLKTNEWPGTFPSRRAAFMADNSKKINLVNMTIKTTAYGQAEGLLLNGEEILLSDVTIVGSGDALQTNGTAYYTNCRLDGDGDSILGRGAAFFFNCELTSIGPFMWIRNTKDNHGNVFVNCKFQTRRNQETVLARAPVNSGTSYPYCEAVLINCSLSGISPEGWGPVGGETVNVHLWEYNSRNISDGKPVDVSKRHPASKQLTMGKDAEIINNYQKPAYVLKGWSPVLAPVVLSQPKPVLASVNQSVVFEVKSAAVPEAGYQWFKNGKIISGAVNSTLKIDNIKPGDAGNYSVKIKNSNGTVTSHSAELKLK